MKIDTNELKDKLEAAKAVHHVCKLDYGDSNDVTEDALSMVTFFEKLLGVVPVRVLDPVKDRLTTLALSDPTVINNQETIANGLRRLRLHGVIPLFVASGDIKTLLDDVEKNSPDLIEAVREVWPLDTSALSEETKSEIKEKANNGMYRWP